MKTAAVRLQLPCVAVLLLGFTFAGCTRDQQGNSTTRERRRIPLAPIGAASPGIGGPGAGSEDTRATGTIATGEGDTPLGTPSTGNVPSSAAGVTPGSAARGGGRL